MKELFMESVVLQGVLTIGLWGTAVYLMVVGQEIPDLLAAGCGAVITFWFNTKTAKAAVAEAARQNAR